MAQMSVEEENEVAPVVIDNGGCLIKAGFASNKPNDAPNVVFPNLIGKQKYQNVFKDDAYIGDKALAKRGILSLKYPIERGIITNWDDMEKIWHYTFHNQLMIAPEEYIMLLTDSSPRPQLNREKMIKSLFETFNVSGFYVENPALLSLYANGDVTGMVCNSGDGVTHCVPIYEGYCIPSAVLCLNLAGKDITEYLQQKLYERNYMFNSTAEKEIVKDVKEKLSYVALDYDDELMKETNELEQNYELPDGQIITIGAERFICSEILFRPNLIWLDLEGIHKLIFQSIMKCDVDIQKDLFRNIVMSGGSTMFNGMVERMQKEIQALNDTLTIKIVAPPQRKYGAWIGGSILASTSTFLDLCITKKEYKESGISMV